jgi:hypothetical protein
VALALHLVERITAANGRVARGVTHGARAIWRRMAPSRRGGKGVVGPRGWTTCAVLDMGFSA